MIPRAEFRAISCFFEFTGRVFEKSQLKPRAAAMIHKALSETIGIKKHVPGVRLVQVADPTLIDIAPAVWSFRYLQVFVYLFRSRFGLTLFLGRCWTVSFSTTNVKMPS